MEAVIFYSWQSDLPNNTNRSFIQIALENAAQRIREDKSISVEPVVDRDTSGVPGTPDIAHTIFEKIDRADVFVCDVTIVNSQTSTSRPTPNPNVLIELGYAWKALGNQRVLLVQNTAYGGPEVLSG
jgi:predicted nucleotide-binding protein